MSGEPYHIIGVSGVVLDAGGRVLLIRTAQAGWELPGGRVEAGEDLLSALRREVMEEAACEVAVGPLTGVTTGVRTPGLAIFTFRCAHRAGEPRPGDDSLEAGWFAADEALRRVTHPIEHLRLRDALEYAGGVVYRFYCALGEGEHRPASYELLGEHRGQARPTTG